LIEWPRSLIEEIAFKRTIIFIGSGVSASSQNDEGNSPPTWKLLLQNATEQFLREDADKMVVKNLIKKELLLDAAEVVFDEVPQPERRRFFRSVFAEPRFGPSEYHSIIQGIDPKITITTNYDQLYEQQCGALVAGQGYAVRKYTDNKILNDVRSKDNLIIKAHGCITDTEDLIITRSDYFKIKREHSQFYNVMDSLLTVNTVLFLGCSMGDPDIQLILENTNIAAHSDHPHYAVLPVGRHRALKRAMESAYNIRVLEYERDQEGGHGILLDSLKALKEEVDSLVLKLR
jgi:hypothetical protein